MSTAIADQQASLAAKESIEEQKETNEKLSKLHELAVVFNDTVKQMFVLQVNDSKNKDDAVSKLTNKNSDVAGDKKSKGVVSKLLNPLNIFKKNKRKEKMQQSLYKILGWSMKKIVKKLDKPLLVEDKNATATNVANNAANAQGAGGAANAMLDAKAVGNMAQTMGSIIAKNLSPGALIKHFFKVLLPKILVAIVLLTIFITKFFNVDIKTAFVLAISIVANAFLLYLGWQLAKSMIAIAFQMFCTSLVTAAKLTAVSIEIAETMMVYAAWMIIIPMVLLCFVLLVAIIAVVVVAVLYLLYKIVEVVVDACVKLIEVLCDFFLAIFGGGKKQDNNQDVNQNTNDALMMLINAGQHVIEEIKNITNDTANAAKQLVSSFTDTIKDIKKAAADESSSYAMIAGSAGMAVIDSIKDIAKDVGSTAKAMFKDIKKTISDMNTKDVGTTVESMFKDIKQSILDMNTKDESTESNPLNSLVEFGQNAINTLEGIGREVAATANTSITFIMTALASFVAMAFAWVTNPLMMSMLAVASFIGFLSGLKTDLTTNPLERNQTEVNQFSIAIEPLVETVKSIKEILLKYASEKSIVNTSIVKTISNINDDNSMPVTNYVKPSDRISDETKYISSLSENSLLMAKLDDILTENKLQNDYLSAIAGFGSEGARQERNTRFKELFKSKNQAANHG